MFLTVENKFQQLQTREYLFKALTIFNLFI